MADGIDAGYTDWHNTYMPIRKPKKAAVATAPPNPDAQLRQAIADSGMSINALAKLAGISQPALQRYAAGNRDLYWASVVKLAVALGMEWRMPR